MNRYAALAVASLLVVCSAASADNGKNTKRVAQTIHNIHAGAVKAESDAKDAKAKHVKGRLRHKVALRPIRAGR